jgi:indole-3-glycerol phosphate synthase
MGHTINPTKNAEGTMKSADYLDKILIHKKQEIEWLIHETKINPQHHLNLISNQTHKPRAHFSAALKGSNLSVIGELKRRSPTCGEIGRIDDPTKLALKYCQGGASAISVLSDAQGFGGSLSDIRQVADSLKIQYPNVSVLRKDFIIHPIQLAEAVFAGAHAVLLIAQAVRKNLKHLIKEAERLGLEVLTEVHDLGDLELALEAEASIIGINHRNLITFEIDLSISRTLRPLIPPHIITIAESGIQHPMQAKQMRELGFDAILVGEALVRSKDPAKLIQLMQGENNES